MSGLRAEPGYIQRTGECLRLKRVGRGLPKGSLRCSFTGHGCAHSHSDGSDEKSRVNGDFTPFRGSPGVGLAVGWWPGDGASSQLRSHRTRTIKADF
jgi:hypothetical protein